MDEDQLKAETRLGMIRTEKDLNVAIEEFLNAQALEIESVDGVALTGVGGSFIEGPVIGKHPVKVDEMQAIGLGAQALAQKRDILAVSMGTGTAFVRVKERSDCAYRRRRRWRRNAGGIGTAVNADVGSGGFN